ncbi:MAG TPA: hypothetical protein VMW66_00560 [Elusimicrobiales bacterium]|nr:hypothetical protein [Elusimicrobiales bacterium]
MSNEKTHWLQNPNKNYIGHWDLPGGKDLTLTIKSAQWEEVKNPVVNTKEAKRVVRFAEDVKPLICNQTNAQSIIDATGKRFMEDSVGCKITLFVSSITDKRTKQQIDCIRVRNAPVIVEKKVLKEGTVPFKNACIYYMENRTFDKVEERYILTDAIKETIKQQVNEVL